MISTDRLRAVRADKAPARRTSHGVALVRRLVAAFWPRLAAIGIGLLAWQLLVWLHWRPAYVLPGPLPVFGRLWTEARAGTLATAVEVTMQRALIGYSLALLIGGAVGLAIARVTLLRRAIASLIAGLQSMPSVAWFPLAILLFRLSESAIVFVVVLGAAPSIANALLAAVDHIPPGLVRAGRSLGAGRVRLSTDVLLPAALPDLLAGMKQAWAFAWRSLLAGELLVVVAHRPSLGARLEFARDFSDAQGLLAWMIVILVIGIAVDACLFAPAQRRLRLTRGLLDRDAAE
jgi:NitT/TauT family transport system permease protein